MGVRSPVLQSARASANAADFLVKGAKAEFLPTLSIVASINRKSDGYAAGDRTTASSLMGRLSIPLYDGGKTSSQVREASALSAQRKLELDAARNEVHRAVTSNWAQMLATRQQIKSAQQQVQATRIALQGSLAQVQFGQKTLLDALNDQREFVNANANLTIAIHDEALATFATAQSAGLITPLEFGYNPSGGPDFLFQETPLLPPIELDLRRGEAIERADSSCGPTCPVQSWILRKDLDSPGMSRPELRQSIAENRENRILRGSSAN